MDEKVIYGLIISLLLFLSASFLIYQRNQASQDNIEEAKEIMTINEDDNSKEKNDIFAKLCDEYLKDIWFTCKIMMSLTLVFIIVLIIAIFKIVGKIFQKNRPLVTLFIFVRDAIAIISSIIMVGGFFFSYGSWLKKFRKALKDQITDIKETDLEEYVNKFKERITMMEKIVLYITPIFGIAGTIYFSIMLLRDIKITKSLKDMFAVIDNKKSNPQ